MNKGTTQLAMKKGTTQLAMKKGAVQPVYIVFAGINGAGKSTFYHSGMWRTEEMPRKMLRVNPDEILAKHQKKCGEAASQLGAGREALKQIRRHLERNVSFNQETTLAGNSALRTIIQAKELGFKVTLFYIGVASPDVAIERVAHRVSLGGHHIDEELVKKRFTRSLSNLAKAIDWADEVTVIDNSSLFSIIAKWSSGTLCWAGDLKQKGKWLLDAMLDDTLWIRPS